MWFFRIFWVASGFFFFFFFFLRFVLDFLKPKKSRQKKKKKKRRANLIIISSGCEEEANIEKSWNFRPDLISVYVCEVHIPDWFCSAQVGDANTTIFVFDNMWKMARYVCIDRDGDLSIDKLLKNPWKFSWLEQKQNIEDLLATPSSKKAYYRDFLEEINKRGFAKCIYMVWLPSEICERRTERSEAPCCHQETLEQDKIETNKLRTRKYRF